VLGHIVDTTVANSPTRDSVRLPTRLLSHPRAGIGTVRAIGKPVITQWMLVKLELMVLMVLGSATTVADMLGARVTCPRRIVRASH
jgi:hypothetical protein